MHLAAMAYNLKKYLKFTQKLAKSEAKALAFFKGIISYFQKQIKWFLSKPNFT